MPAPFSRTNYARLSARGIPACGPFWRTNPPALLVPSELQMAECAQDCRHVAVPFLEVTTFEVEASLVSP
jgi:hypothetical protein